MHDQIPPLPASLRNHYQWLLARSGAPPARLLDIGAGQGRLLSLARDVVRGRIVGIDPKPPGRSPDHPIARVVGDGMRLPIADRSFDFVVETETLEWVRDPVRLLREAARVCTPDGLVVSDDTDWDTLVFAASDAVLGRRILRAFCDSGPNGWIGRMAPSLMRRAGLRDVQVHVRVISEQIFKPGALGFWQVQVIDEWLRAKALVTAQELADWRADLQQAADRGDYLFSANRYVCVGRPA
ncbi:MAG: methyltransferase domain-containing protein [Chloroflexi bacterium]|nr:methyltransferase domain-containing protein [Chloroflexota bacterium]